MFARLGLSLGVLCSLVLAVSAVGTEAAGAAEPLRALIFTGKHNHDWRKTTPVLKRIYEESGRFVVDITTDPSTCDAQTLAKYDVVIGNWTNWPSEEREWGAGTEDALLDFVRGGKGFALFHAGGSTFFDWPEFQQLIGATWGKGATGHGPRHAFKVTITDTDHPVTRDMNDFWTTDELWHNMSTQPTMHVLATAFSAKEKGGTDKNEPVVIWTQFGQGRCFNLVLGHDVAAMQTVGWRMLMLRGTEWAATGEATIDTPVDPDLALKAIGAYRFGESRAELAKVEQLVHYVAPNPALRKQVAAKLAAMLDSDATTDCKKFICRQLSLIGSGAEVPVLARLLDDKDLSFAARFALERIPGPEAVAAR